jgi:hypothetical protein
MNDAVDFDNRYHEPEDACTRFGDDEVRHFVRWLTAGKRKHLMFGTAMDSVPTAAYGS